MTLRLAIKLPAASVLKSTTEWARRSQRRWRIYSSQLPHGEVRYVRRLLERKHLCFQLQGRLPRLRRQAVWARHALRWSLLIANTALYKPPSMTFRLVGSPPTGLSACTFNWTRHTLVSFDTVILAPHIPARSSLYSLHVFTCLACTKLKNDGAAGAFRMCSGMFIVRPGASRCATWGWVVLNWTAFYAVSRRNLAGFPVVHNCTLAWFT